VEFIRKDFIPPISGGTPKLRKTVQPLSFAQGINPVVSALIEKLPKSLICDRHSGRLFQGRWPEGLNLLSKFSCNLSKQCAFCRGDPFKTKSRKVNAKYPDQFLGQFKHLFGLYITIQVMAVTYVSPGHQHTVSTHLKCFENEIGVNPTRTHHPDNTHIRRILKTADACQISSRICAPVTGKNHYLWTKFIRHRVLLKVS